VIKKFFAAKWPNFGPVEKRQACIAIDVGNTRAKAVRFDGYDIRTPWELSQENLYKGFPWAGEDAALPKILASVRHPEDPLVKALMNEPGMHLLTADSPLSFELDYQTRDTLGADRLALVAGGIDAFPGADLLIIDAGSCITADLVLEGKRYCGGSISPGIGMRLKAMHHFTGALPDVSFDRISSFPGKSTRDSLLCGAAEGALLEVQGRIDSLRQQYPALKVILAGGDSHYFVENLKNSIFAIPDLVLLGLRSILYYDIEKK
jgi:type III pantothenate kinase